MRRYLLRWSTAFLFVLSWCPPARATVLLAQQEGQTPSVGYGVGLVASALVLLVVCWPVKRE
jgi:hypothetical protein